MIRSPRICYIICSSPRSGSHLYSSLLAATGIAGNPEEHFNPWGAGQRHGGNVDGLVYGAEYVAEVIAQSTTANGVFGTKAQFNQITSFVGLGRLESLFPTELKYLYVERRDELRQGVSLAIARQTGQFFWNEPAQREPVYNPEQIRCCLEEIMNQKKGWKTYFWERRIEPLQVMYEDLVSRTREIIVETLNYLEIEVPEDFVVPESPLKRQANQVSDEWVIRYKNSVFYRGVSRKKCVSDPDAAT